MRFIQEFLALSGLALQAAVVRNYWNRLPEQIPTHFGAGGSPDGFGAKSMLVLLPAIALGLYLLLTALSFFPGRFSYPVTVTDRSRSQLYAIAIAMLGWLKVEVISIFAYITWVTIQVALGLSAGLGSVFLPLVLVVVAATVVIGIVQMRRVESDQPLNAS
jgi:uncharacterized membrane protein